VNCKLPPILTRRLMDNDGKFYLNYKTALPSLMVNMVNPIMSNNVVDVSLFPYSGSYVHPDVNGGRSFQMRFPFAPESPLLPIYRYLAFEELRYKSNRSAKDYQTSNQGPALKRFTVNNFPEKDELMDEQVINLGDLPEVKTYDQKRTLQTSYSAPSLPTYIPETVYRPPEMALVRKNSATRRERGVNLPTGGRLITQPLGASLVQKVTMSSIGDMAMVKPVLPCVQGKEYGKWTKEDADIVKRLTSGKVDITNMDYVSRHRAHDALCVVWNATYIKKLKADRDLLKIMSDENGHSWFSRSLANAEKNQKALVDAMYDLETLEESFRQYKHFVTAYTEDV